jgi:hypothetical protein
MCSQNAANAISGAQISKIFRGACTRNPPRILVPSARAPPIFHEVSATDPKGRGFDSHRGQACHSDFQSNITNINQ